MKTLPYKQFKDEVWNHLASLIASRHGENVLWGDRNGQKYKHILNVENRKKKMLF